MLNHKQKFSAGREKARRLAPYFQSCLYGLMPTPVKGMREILEAVHGSGAAMAVSDDYKLYYDPDVIEQEWTTDDMTFGLLHEVGHLLRDHSGLQKLGNFDKMDWNLAGDAVINHGLVEMGLTPLDTDILPSRIPDGNGGVCEGGKTELFYYEKLKNLPKNQNQNQNGQGGAGGCPQCQKDQQGQGQQQQGQGQQQGQQQGQGQGQQQGQQQGQCPHQGSGSMKSNHAGHMCGSGAGNKLKELEGEGGQGGKDKQPGRSQADIRSIKKAVAGDIKKHAKEKGRGSVPGDWGVWADQELEPPKIRWQDRTARVCRGSITRSRGVHDYSYGRPSRRQAGLGYGVGIPVLPTMVRAEPIVWFCVDTSGSMGEDDLRLAMQEAAGAIKSMNGKIYFAACDATVQSDGVKKVSSISEAIKMLKGGGGTDFRPIFEYMDKLPKSERPTLLVFGTDGGGPAPNHAPPGIDVVWLLTGEHAVIPYNEDMQGHIDWGEQIFVDDNGTRKVEKKAS